MNVELKQVDNLEADGEVPPLPSAEELAEHMTAVYGSAEEELFSVRALSTLARAWGDAPADSEDNDLILGINAYVLERIFTFFEKELSAWEIDAPREQIFEWFGEWFKDRAAPLIEPYIHPRRICQLSEDELMEYVFMCPELEEPMSTSFQDFFVSKLLETKSAYQTELAGRDDFLDNLYNRVEFRRRLRTVLCRLLHPKYSSDEPVALVMVDLDHFKGVNDSHGHDAGDELLKAAADILESMSRQDFDILARTGDFNPMTDDDEQKDDSGSEKGMSARQGGDEFVTAYRNMSLKDAKAKAEKLVKAFRDHPLLSQYGVTASIGVAHTDHIIHHFPESGYEGDHDSYVDAFLDRFMKSADDAQAISKDEGRNRATCAWERNGSSEVNFWKQAFGQVALKLVSGGQGLLSKARRRLSRFEGTRQPR